MLWPRQSQNVYMLSSYLTKCLTRAVTALRTRIILLEKRQRKWWWIIRNIYSAQLNLDISDTLNQPWSWRIPKMTEADFPSTHTIEHLKYVQLRMNFDAFVELDWERRESFVVGIRPCGLRFMSLRALTGHAICCQTRSRHETKCDSAIIEHINFMTSNFARWLIQNLGFLQIRISSWWEIEKVIHRNRSMKDKSRSASQTMSHLKVLQIAFRDDHPSLKLSMSHYECSTASASAWQKTEKQI